MPNTVQHTLHPIVWAICVGVAIFGGSPLVIIASSVVAIPFAIYSGLADLYGVWKGSSPGWGFDSTKGDWAGYVSSHHGEFAEKHKKNPLYAFHLWQDKFSHGDPEYFLSIFKGTPVEIRKQQSFWNDFINDILLSGLLVAVVGLYWAVCIILAVGICLYTFKILSWRLHQ